MYIVLCVLFLVATALAEVSSNVLIGGYIIELTNGNTVETFKQAANAIKYTVRLTFDNPAIFLGLSIQLADTSNLESQKTQLEALPGVKSVSEILQYELPPEPSSSFPPQNGTNITTILGKRSNVRRGLNSRQEAPSDLSFTLQMGGVDKLHAEGIKGKGIKIGIIDTGIDYKHPALGGGLGAGKKIAGGYTWITDDGRLIESPDPYANCQEAHHATHVAGIITFALSNASRLLRKNRYHWNGSTSSP
jgi:hypothetical protein